MINFINQIINGLSTGSMYALVAIGYTMVYGIAKMINFAHGDIIMAGAYFALIAMGFVGPIPAILFSIVATAALGVLTEKVAYKPLRGKGSLEVLITAIGVSYLLENVFLLIFGSAARTFAIGSGLGAIAGVIYGCAYSLITPYIGLMLGIKAFIAAVLGGIGSVSGAMVGGLMLGVAESLTIAYISSDFSDAVVFGILIIVLLVKPAGLFGKNVREKV